MTALIPNRTEFRFTGHNDVVYGRGLTALAALDDARAMLGEPMMSQAAVDENGYIVEVEQRCDTYTGEWIDVK
ncbi:MULTISPECIES: hypothetical protein [Burkholderia]|uniref:Uncharacterized protein n=1 Tax=Burkholderia pseudomultivorans TaxID=1207504 RepID=A0ABU2ED24_9BURK|nr:MULTISPECIES: hypothetical protein [Burkholderia]MDR8731332.1 hypothetical protein [Burkholderia pseudomultivorans]MDR8738953.1 hypothetical protein [Burkholderia pseudomultivorans]MDR8745504.1 hypothetical protein [Burkholderia pseudomultivorans]MDR8757794.1 hypothetical protein [Burkholderia pseudomultivorans]MDR8781894.1 hypothetical protein [Burkholderia pseudomultivorans]